MFLPAVLLHALVAGAGGLSLALVALVEFVALGSPRRFIASHFIRVNIGWTVGPGAAPRPVVDDHGASIPYKAVDTPAPRPERESEGHAKIETDSRSQHKAWPGWGIDDQR